MRTAIVSAWAALIVLGVAGAAHAARPVVAVFDIEARGVSLKRVELDRLADYVAAELSASGRFEVVPRSQLKRALTTQKKESYRACYEESCQIEIGKELAAEKTVAARISRFGKSCLVTLELYDLRKATAERGGSHRGACEPEAVLSSLEAALAELAGPRKAAAPKAPPKPEPVEPPRDASAHRIASDWPDAPARGPTGAPVEVVVFADFQCPYSARMRQALESVLKAHPDRIRLVFKHFPLAFHPRAEPAARAAVAAHRQGRFWPMAKRLFDGQGSLSRTDVLGYAREVGLDVKRFVRDFRSRSAARRVQEDIADGKALGVRGTPTTFINGEKLGGAQPREKLEALVQDALRDRP